MSGRERRSRRALVGVLAAALLFAAALVPSPQTTDAAFTDDEYAQTGFAAMELRPPQIQSIVTCASFVLGNSVTLDWRWPDEDGYESFSPNPNAQWAFNSSGNNWQTVATTSQGGGIYRTTFNTNVISNLLDFLLGQSTTFRVRTRVGDNWVSSTSSTVGYNGGFLGLSPSCTGPVNG